MRNPFLPLALGLLILLVAAPARADTGMAFLELGAMQLFLVALVVVAIETGGYRFVFRQRFGALVGLVAVANLASYLAGLPLLWLVSNEGPLYTLVNQYRNPLLSLGLMLGSFVLSVLIEAPLLTLGLKLDKRRVWRACVGANLASYLLVTLLSFPFTYFPNNGIRPLFQVPAEETQARPDVGLTTTSHIKNTIRTPIAP